MLNYDEQLADADAAAHQLVNQPMRSRSPSSQMPPLGTVLRDVEAVDRLNEWISLDLVRRSHR